MAPVLRAMRARGIFDIDLVALSQHTALLDRALVDCELEPSARINLADAPFPLAESLSAAVQAVAARLRARPSRAMIVQGDTTSTLGGALAGFYATLPIAHVEAGLRSGDAGSPFPEEMHRALVDRLATVLYAPTAQSRENLLREGADPARVVVVGNTSIDALVAMRAESIVPQRDRRAHVLVTCHRRESFGEGVRGVCGSIKALVERHPEVEVDYVLHPHPAAHTTPRELLGGLARVTLHEPMAHREFLRLLVSARVVLTDSGGVQEEAAFLRRPLLVLRAGTERVEAVQRGVASVVGTSPDTVLPALIDALNRGHSAQLPFDEYGDGHAGERIADDLASRLERGW